MSAAKTEHQCDIHKQLLAVIAKVDRPGDFVVSANRPVLMPGLTAGELGVISLPLPKSQARELIKLCHQAPYGKGTETVVDTGVRRVWELDCDQFKITNSAWKTFVDSIVNEVKTGLGLENRKLAAYPYKLLVYEKGGFFLPHRDGEKLDSMVATLVICLPSVHKGGELIVSHEGQQREIRMDGAASGLEISYAAFYADCEHEIRPVTSGYRLCLTYNITLEKSRGKKRLAAPSYGSTTTEIAKLLDEWTDTTTENPAEPLSEDFDPRLLAITLDHRYTQDGLNIDRLKGTDRARAEVLFAAAEQADCIAHLALLTLWQNGSAEGGYDDYGYGYGRGRHYRKSYDDYDDDDDDDDEDETAANESPYIMGEVFDESLTADHWSNQQGNKVLLGEMTLEENEIVSVIPPKDWEASREDFEGYTGNAGMTLERWYHRAAIIIWPRAQHFDVLCKTGTESSIAGLQVMMQSLPQASKSKRESLLQECIAFANAIISSWQVDRGPRFSFSAYQKLETVDRNLFPALLSELDDAHLVRNFISRLMSRDGQIQLDKSLLKFCQQQGWEQFESELASLFEFPMIDLLPRNATLIAQLCVRRDKNPQRIRVCTHLVDKAVAQLIACDQESAQANSWRSQELDRSAILASLAQAMLAIGADKPLQTLVDHALASPNQYDVTDVHLAAIFSLKSQIAKLTSPSPAITHWLDACQRELTNRTAAAPQPPADFRREHTLRCKCADCRTLSTFLADPDKKELRLPLAKHRRQHLHMAIDDNRCDLTHVTERRGRPYTLVCTKTTASHQAARQIYDRDSKNLTRLQALIKKTH